MVRFFGNIKNSFKERSLPFVEESMSYQKYEVIKDIPHVDISRAAPAFDQPGMALQYDMNQLGDLNYLLENGYLRRIDWWLNVYYPY